MVECEEGREVLKKVDNSKNEIMLKRKGGGTLIESRPLFSSDNKYIYLNCGWGVRIFNLKTGERVRTCDAECGTGSVVCLLLYRTQPAAVTSDGRFVVWERKSDKKLIDLKVPLEEGWCATGGFLVPGLANPETALLCLSVCHRLAQETQIFLKFFCPETGHPEDTHPLQGQLVSDMKTTKNISAGGPEEDPFLATISQQYLNVYALNGKSRKEKIKTSGGCRWVCVRVHPAQYTVAAGDSLGRAVLFTNPFGKGGRRPQAVFHWHTLPCQDIAFTPAGSVMYTGGGEQVLVRWSLEGPELRNFLPRLSGQILYLEVASDNQSIAITTTDNKVKLVDPQLRLECVLHEMSWGAVPPGALGGRLFPAGLLWHPTFRALLLNARVGHLQIYSPFTQSHVFHIDVTEQNLLTQERNKTIVNTEVVLTGVSSDGRWMATLEEREDPGWRLEQRLKLWTYAPLDRRFSLNSSIENPHNGRKTRCLRFRPGAPSTQEPSLDYGLVTSGQDDKLRLWTPSHRDTIHQDSALVWSCEAAGEYRHQQCGPVSFCEDGSVLGVAWGHSLALYDSHNLQLHHSLSRQGKKDPIRFIEFGMSESSHRVITCGRDEVVVYDLKQLRVEWCLAMSGVSLLVQDPASSFFAVFTTTNTVSVFKSSCPEPAFSRSELCDREGEVLSAVFVPREHHPPSTAPPWSHASHLFFINSNQELLCFESAEESRAKLELDLQQLTAPHGSTPFSQLQASHTLSEVTNPDKPTLYNSISFSSPHAAFEQLLKYGPYTMPPLSLTTGQFVDVFRKRTRRQTGAEEDMELELGEEESDRSESSDCEEGKSWFKRTKKKHK